MRDKVGICRNRNFRRNCFYNFSKHFFAFSIFKKSSGTQKRAQRRTEQKYKNDGCKKNRFQPESFFRKLPQKTVHPKNGPNKNSRDNHCVILIKPRKLVLKIGQKILQKTRSQKKSNRPIKKRQK